METDIGESQTDARVFMLPTPSQAVSDVETFLRTNTSALYYDLTEKGQAIIFNHYEYKSKERVTIPKRHGTEFDTARLKSCLENLNFNVTIFNDLKVNDIEMQMKLIKKKKRSEISCLIVVVMTHGEPGSLYAADDKYETNMLWDGLTARECPHLAGIPKLYFIQACRGDKIDRGYTVTDSILFPSQPRRNKLKIPSMADFLHMYSTYEDHSSWREVDGSWFIQSLCEVFEEEAPHWDLLQLLTFVNKKVAFEYESYSRDPTVNQMKQIPQVKSMLTKLLKFKVIGKYSETQHVSDVQSFLKNNSSTLYYDMTEKGLAIIFNHYKCTTEENRELKPREGTQHDADRLKSCLKNLNFNVTVFDDLKVAEIQRQLKLIKMKQRNEISCLIIVVMTHGDTGILGAADTSYKLNMLWGGLTANECPHLVGIPKLYFIQACRGNKLDQGHSVIDGIPEHLPPKSNKVKVLQMADFLQMYSTYDDHVSWRESNGTWFIQSLCEVLENEALYWDLVQLLTFVNKKVAYEYESSTKTQKSTDGMKQIPQVKSMLTKLLKFKVVKSLNETPV
ncbi:uncharacterized protein LOC143920159 [Arctopsyche grandis]|uniref:uncharacterized protein LOC143920159 n=1 Tax=Arctopsyche grandis TaxID=121162 RepID=UPI00406D9CE7